MGFATWKSRWHELRIPPEVKSAPEGAPAAQRFAARYVTMLCSATPVQHRTLRCSAALYCAARCAAFIILVTHDLQLSSENPLFSGNLFYGLPANRSLVRFPANCSATIPSLLPFFPVYHAHWVHYSTTPSPPSYYLPSPVTKHSALSRHYIPLTQLSDGTVSTQPSVSGALCYLVL